MKKTLIALFITIFCHGLFAQLFIGRDTITVIENDTVLKMPWANGINYSNVSNIDLNLDGRKDILVFDRVNLYNVGHFRCFINTGTLIAGETTYSANPDLSAAFPPVSNWAVCRDYNCDGKEDLFCSTSAGIMVYANKSYTNAGGPATLSFSLVSSLIYSNYNPNTNPPIMGNLYAATNGVPGIEDIDGDGDLDILTFEPQGTFVEWHKNLSIENGWNCDSLRFQLSTGCWGHIVETSCSISMNQTCTARPAAAHREQSTSNSLHAGSCLTCFDNDGDGDKDLIMGDVSCNYILFGNNGGSATAANITATSGVYPNYPNAGNTQQIIINNFPCTYILDVNGDNKKDLVATPNTTDGQNYKSMWYYKNASTTSTANFQYVKRNLFQDEMIEVGQNSFPVLFDYDADGKKDLLIGTYGYYNPPIGLQSQLALYRNTGTLSQPSFSLITRDYASVLSHSLNCVMPTVGDIDGDGDVDILLGTQTGQIHWLKNTAGPGAVCSFSFINNPFNLPTSPSSVAVTAAAAPQLFDIDKDQLLDLMVGGKNGKIWYYKNIGTATAPSFSFITNHFGQVNVQGPSNIYGIDGFAAPFFYDDAGTTKLLVGSITGSIYYYSVPSATSACNLIISNANFINEGAQSSPFFEDINGDGKRDLFLGNGSGGLSFFSSLSSVAGIKDINTTDKNLISLFPNPANQTVNIRVEQVEVEKGEVCVTDILGKEVKRASMNSNSASLDISSLNTGIYFVKITVGNHSQTLSVTKKVIKE